MKKYISLMILVVLSVTAGCGIKGSPPDYSINYPVVLPTDSGEVFVAYQINSGSGVKRSTYLQSLGERGEPLWQNEGMELASDKGGFQGDGDHTFAALIEDQEKNICAIYPLADGIGYRKIEPQGNMVSSPVKIPVAAAMGYSSFKVVSDNSGGAITAWIADNNNVSIFHLDPEGNILWQRTLATPGIDKFDMVCDSLCNTFILWNDNPLYSNSEGDIYLSKVDSSGTFWDMDSLLLTEINGPVYPSDIGLFTGRIISDDDGGAIVVWGTSGRLFVQRVTSDGELLWDDGIMIADATSDTRISRNESGYVVFWQEGPVIHAQSIGMDGQSLWSQAGIEQSVESEKRQVFYSPSNSDESGNVAFVWNYIEEGKQLLRAQCLDISGNKLWGEEGVMVSSKPAYWAGYAAPARITSDGTGGFIVSWVSGDNIKDNTSSWVQKINSDGTVFWGEDGIRLDR